MINVSNWYGAPYSFHEGGIQVGMADGSVRFISEGSSLDTISAATSFGATQVIIDQYTGNVLAVRNARQLTAGDDFVAWQFPLHNGEAFGLAVRLVAFASGIAPAVLYVTGVMLRWRRRRPRRREELREPLTMEAIRNVSSAVKTWCCVVQSHSEPACRLDDHVNVSR